MNKKALWILIIVVVLVVGTGAYAFNTKTPLQSDEMMRADDQMMQSASSTDAMMHDDMMATSTDSKMESDAMMHQ